jgi:VanZ family protein
MLKDRGGLNRACLLFVAAVTLSPLYLRPRLMQSETTLIVLLEHVGAFVVVGFLFSLAYTRTALVCIIVLGSAVILELLQLVVPDRDARVMDAVQKLVGGVVGIIAARFMCALVFANSKRDEPALGMKDEVGICKPVFRPLIGARLCSSNPTPPRLNRPL